MSEYYAVERSGTSLTHHGIIGMKWGVRRYQNKDGSLTPAGREHYGTGESRKSITTKSSNDNIYWKARRKLSDIDSKMRIKERQIDTEFSKKIRKMPGLNKLSDKQFEQIYYGNEGGLLGYLKDKKEKKKQDAYSKTDQALAKGRELADTSRIKNKTEKSNREHSNFEAAFKYFEVGDYTDDEAGIALSLMDRINEKSGDPYSVAMKSKAANNQRIKADLAHKSWFDADIKANMSKKLEDRRKADELRKKYDDENNKLASIILNDIGYEDDEENRRQLISIFRR